MRFYGIDFSVKYIIFEDDENDYAISFEEDIFGNLKVLSFARGPKSGEKCIGIPVKEITVKSTRPNIFGRINYLVFLTVEKIKTLIKKKYNQFL